VTKIEQKNNEFLNLFNDIGLYHFEKLFLVNNKKFIKGCGSYLFNGQNYIYDSSMIEKQELLFELSKKNNKILEIGSYMGHSILIMLLANPKAEIVSIDNNHLYSKPSLEYLQKNFPKAKITFIHNDSLKGLKNLNEKFELFHVDGTHRHEVIYKEFQYILNLKSDDRVKILFDDIIAMPHLKKNILHNLPVEKIILPKSNHCLYVEINCNTKFFKQNLKKFEFQNFRDFIKYRLLKVFVRKAIRNGIVRNRKTIKLWNLTFEKFLICRNIKDWILKKIY
jgi:hypothetical protein